MFSAIFFCLAKYKITDTIHTLNTGKQLGLPIFYSDQLNIYNMSACLIKVNFLHTLNTYYINGLEYLEHILLKYLAAS